MADKKVSELVSAEQITARDWLLVEQNGTAKKVSGQVLLNWLTAAADGHGGIQSYTLLNTEGLVKTYRFTLADKSHMDIPVIDGRGIRAVEKIGTNGLVDTYQIRYNDETTGEFFITNGAKGEKGDSANIWVRYASQKPTDDSSNFGEVPDVWVGIASGHSPNAPADWREYQWFQWKGEKGDPGDPATLVSATVTYQAGSSGTIIPSGSWSQNVPVVHQGHYLWTKVVQQFNSGDPVTAYSVSRMGLDGLGSVVSVAGLSPDATGNVPLTAENLRALSLLGGKMEGSIDMNGQRITGLNEPLSDTEPAPKAYVDAMKTIPKKFTLRESGWVGSGPYTYEIAVDGLTDQVFARAYPETPEDAAEEDALAIETAKINSCKRSGNLMTFRCPKNKPVLDIPVIVEVYA